MKLSTARFVLCRALCMAAGLGTLGTAVGAQEPGFVMAAAPTAAPDHLSVFSSKDGVDFTTLATGAFVPGRGQVRDPSILKAADGFYYVAYGTGRDGHSFGVARSPDLMHWQGLGDVDVGLAGVTNVATPEWLRDRDGQVHVVVSLSKGGAKGPFNAYVMRAVDLAAGKFAPAVAMDGLSGVDVFPVVYSTSYGAFVRNATSGMIEFATAEHLTGPWTVGRRGDWARWGPGLEGPAVAAVTNAHGQAGVRVYFSDAATGRTWFSDSYDALRTWTPRAEAGGVSGAVRAFSVMAGSVPMVAPMARPQSVVWDGRGLTINGQRTVILSGEFAPAHLPSPGLWRDVLQKMKATGYNAVTLDFDWAYSSSVPGQFDFSGVRDMERAVSEAEAAGLYVIIRPGPYLGADLSRGGLPDYADEKNLADYAKQVAAWDAQVDAIVSRHQLTTGAGRVIAVASAGDKARSAGITVPVIADNAGAGTAMACMERYDVGKPEPVADVTPGVSYLPGGARDVWGSPWLAECNAARMGSGYVRTALGADLINGSGVITVRPAFGGTSWGWMAGNTTFTSYDFGAGIDEGRGLRDKQYTLKEMGLFVQAATPLLGNMDKGAALTASSPAVRLYHGRSPAGDVVLARHEPSEATGDDAFSFDISTRDGTYHVPQAGTLRIKGQDAKLMLADYGLERTHLVYTTSSLLTHLRQGARDVAVLYGPRGEDGETVLKFAGKPEVAVLSGDVAVTWDARRHELRLNYVHTSMSRVRIEVGPVQLDLMLAEDTVAKTFWRQETPQGPVLERSYALIRTAQMDGGTLKLTGDTDKDSDIEIWAPAAVTGLTFNGAPVTFESMAGALWATGLAGPKAVTVPDLMQGQWFRRKDSLEAEARFDDGSWRAVEVAAEAPGSSAGRVGQGDNWYRGRFKVTGQSPETLNLTFDGGLAGLVQVWMDGRFMGERDGGLGDSQPTTVTASHFYLPKLKGGEHVVSVMARNNAGGLAPGLMAADLRHAPIRWKIQGPGVHDAVRGAMNLGGLYGERNGWYLPIDPYAEQTGWELGAVDDDPPAAGTYWLRTRFKLDLPKDQDVQLGLVIGDADVPRTSHRTRMLIFVNGWQVGNFIGHVGPQKTFMLPAGLVNGQGDNTLTFAVTTDGRSGNAPEPVKLVVVRNVRGGVEIR